MSDRESYSGKMRRQEATEGKICLCCNICHRCLGCEDVIDDSHGELVCSVNSS